MQMSSNGAVMGMSIAPMPRDYAAIPLAQNKFEQQVQNGIMVAGEILVSTFSIDVDTGSYATLRRMLRKAITRERHCQSWGKCSIILPTIIPFTR